MILYRLDKTVSVKRPTVTQDDSGRPVETFEVLSIIQAAIQPVSVKEQNEMNKDTIIATHRMFSRVIDINEQDRILTADGTEYDITEVKNAAGIGHHLEILLKEVE